MSKEYVLQFNLNNYISAEESYKKDLGTVIIGKVNDDSGILKVLFDSDKEDIVNFFIELINYVADLEAKLAEHNEYFKSFSCKDFNEFQDFISTFMLTPHEEQTLIQELKQQLAEKEEQLKNAIVPKFKVGQEVWYIDTRVNSFNEQRDKIESYLIDSIVITNEQFRYYGDDGLWLGDNEIFATKEEAQAKLEELKGE